MLAQVSCLGCSGYSGESTESSKLTNSIRNSRKRKLIHDTLVFSIVIISFLCMLDLKI
jgi:hypothetical protein